MGQRGTRCGRRVLRPLGGRWSGVRCGWLAPRHSPCLLRPLEVLLRLPLPVACHHSSFGRVEGGLGGGLGARRRLYQPVGGAWDPVSGSASRPMPQGGGAGRRCPPSACPRLPLRGLQPRGLTRLCGRLSARRRRRRRPLTRRCRRAHPPPSPTRRRSSRLQPWPKPLACCSFCASPRAWRRLHATARTRTATATTVATTVAAPTTRATPAPTTTRGGYSGHPRTHHHSGGYYGGHHGCSHYGGYGCAHGGSHGGSPPEPEFKCGAEELALVVDFSGAQGRAGWRAGAHLPQPAVLLILAPSTSCPRPLPTPHSV